MSLAYSREIDGLRAVAVAAVVLYHAGIGEAGYVGVDVFFVISGYLITGLLLGEHERTGRIDLPDFYARRVRRILPAVSVLLLAVLAASWLLLEARERILALESAGAAALFVANLFFQHNTFGYFDDHADAMPLLHLWTLSVEEQFYLAWPALLMVLLRLRIRPAWSIAIAAAVSFGWAEWLMTRDPSAAFYQMPPRFWELAAGGLIAALPARPLPWWAPWLGLLVVADACLVPVGHFPGYGALPAVAGSMLLIAAIRGGAKNALLASPPFVGLGLISYSLYLWHWPLLAFYRALGGADLSVRLGLCALALLLAVGSYRYVEQPARRRLGTRPALALGFAAMAVLALSAFGLGHRENQTPAAKAARDWPANKETCNRQRGDTTLPGPECASGPGPVRVALWGDSMALAWQPLAWELAGRQQVAAIAYSRNQCRPALGFADLTGAECLAWNEAVLPKVRDLDTVILVGRWDYGIDPALQSGLERTLASLSGVRRVILLGPTPVLRAKAPACMDGDDLARCAVSRAGFRRSSTPAREMLSGLAGRYRNVEYLEVGDWFCEPLDCRAIRGEMALYWDNSHVSSSAARAFARRFSSAPERAGAD